jgi:hypothetical protein
VGKKKAMERTRRPGEAKLPELLIIGHRLHDRAFAIEQLVRSVHQALGEASSPKAELLWIETGNGLTIYSALEAVEVLSESIQQDAETVQNSAPTSLAERRTA